jgi:hypothetical protein
MDTMQRFLSDEISSQELYVDICNFINSYHIRSGEFEGNYYIIKKLDQINFLIYAENIFSDGHREIPYSLSVYKQILIDAIQEHARTIRLELIT